MPNVDLTQVATAAIREAQAFQAEQDQAQAELHQRLARWLDAFVSGYPAAEKLSFSDQNSAALAILNAAPLNSVEQTLVSGATAITGETEADWAARVMAKATAFASAVSTAAGLRTKHQGLIAAAGDAAALAVARATMRADLDALP
jgi:hypothetical protein